MTQATRTPAEQKPATKVEFVLGLPLDMLAADVAKKAQQAGITISQAHVHVIRSNAKRAANLAPAPNKGQAPKKPASKNSKPATPKRAAQRPPGRGTNSDFIRTLPPTMPIAEVMQKAKEAGYSFSADLIRKARAVGRLSSSKTVKPKLKTPVNQAQKPKASKLLGLPKVKPSGSRPKKPSAPKPRPGAPTRTTTAAKPVVPVAPQKAPTGALMTPEMVFVRLALDIGLQKAKDLLASVHEKLAALVLSVR